LNVTHKKPYKRYEGETNDLLIAFFGYVNDLNKLQQFKVSVQKSHHRFQCTFQLPWQRSLGRYLNAGHLKNNFELITAPLESNSSIK